MSIMIKVSKVRNGNCIQDLVDALLELKKDENDVVDILRQYGIEHE